jgi:hypothetical protein
LPSLIPPDCLTYICLSYSLSFGTENSVLFCAVRAGTGGDEAGIWAGDLVGRSPIEYDLANEIVYLLLFGLANSILKLNEQSLMIFMISLFNVQEGF